MGDKRRGGWEQEAEAINPHVLKKTGELPCKIPYASAWPAECIQTWFKGYYLLDRATRGRWAGAPREPSAKLETEATQKLS